MNLEGTLELVSLTDVGRMRDHNEDAAAVDAALGMALVADGMGGHAGGEVASAIAVQVIGDRLGESVRELEAGQSDDESGFALETLCAREAIVSANQAIFGAAERQPRYKGMGTTVVLALFHDNRVTLAHVGDSRIYRLRGDGFERLTRDHSLAEDMVDRGFYSTLGEAATAGISNIITRALGVEPQVEVEIQEDLVVAGDIYLLCSDGLSDMVPDPEIHLTLSTFSASLELAAQKLIELANEKGGRDNISVVLARPKKNFPARRGLKDRVADWFI